MSTVCVIQTSLAVTCPLGPFSQCCPWSVPWVLLVWTLQPTRLHSPASDPSGQAAWRSLEGARFLGWPWSEFRGRVQGLVRSHAPIICGALKEKECKTQIQNQVQGLGRGLHNKKSSKLKLTFVVKPTSSPAHVLTTWEDLRWFLCGGRKQDLT